ncbi:Uncharacterized membrane protein [Ectothiorhodospira mobilis]|uniref:Uncharacterized membrane protein n=1 Tax=Ectothiorhodospira mobilis TaxID=195064 RepID=A0A1I4SZX1_ECTMO|nr:Uncharacterized membrane protein [Ectothiorhodospira mobilis]
MTDPKDDEDPEVGSTGVSLPLHESFTTLKDHLRSGRLGEEEQKRLAALLEGEDEAGGAILLTGIRKELFTGPLPPADQLNRYDEETRAVILRMAEKEQAHEHDMRERSLLGAIRKDRRGQYMGLIIALSGLLAAAWIAPSSATAAAIIGGLDLFGMVTVFVAPRILERTQRESPESTH